MRAGGALAAGLLWATGALAQGVPPPGLTLAIFGDQGIAPFDPDSVAVLELVRDRGADAVVHVGDFDYQDDPAAWEAQIDAVLGPDFPYFASAGNHDKNLFRGAGGYQERLAARLSRLGIPWEGDLGVQSSLTWRGILILLTAPRDFGSGDGFHDLYLRERLAQSDAIWRVSGWHRNMRLMQVGDKDDDTGWGVYEESRRGGAFVATAHEHSYSRSHGMRSFEFQTVANATASLVLSADDAATEADEGRSFAFVSGLGGRSIRSQVLDGDWWATIHTSSQGADFGALFATFHVDGDPRRARFAFVEIGGAVVEEFSVLSAVGAGPACANGLDDDADGLADHPDDPGCAGPADASENDPLAPCDDGEDDDGDGRADAADLGCAAPNAPREDPQCQDGLDNDGDDLVDFDGGISAGLPPQLQTEPDPQCLQAGSNREGRRRCGLGWEMALPVAILARRGRHSRRRAPGSRSAEAAGGAGGGAG